MWLLRKCKYLKSIMWLIRNQNEDNDFLKLLVVFKKQKFKKTQSFPFNIFLYKR